MTDFPVQRLKAQLLIAVQAGDLERSCQFVRDLAVAAGTPAQCVDRMALVILAEVVARVVWDTPR